MRQDFQLKGGHVFAILIAAFAAVIAANAVFITLAVRTFPGEEAKKSYVQGIAYNQRLAERDAQALLGWTAEIVRLERAGAGAEIELAFFDAQAAPLAGLEISGTLGRLVAQESHALAFREIAPGRYVAGIEAVGPGAWRLDASARGADAALFRLQKKLALP